MRAGLSSIQQTLTPEASTVLNQSIAEARRRNHGQTTPLHVAATLLASPSGYLRTACIRSHPNSSHPLQCRALELCFSVALERLTTAQSQSSSPGLDPPISNALMAALKRAQAHQRRGCPEQQQQPLLAVKVELEQLIISILDDPSVSRVMREASFSSPAVKATVEQSLSTSVVGIQHHHVGGFGGGRIGGNGMQLSSQLQTRLMNNNNSSTALLTTSPVLLNNNNNNNKSSYLNPRLQNCSAGTGGLGSRNEEVKKVLEIMIRGKKKNPVLVGDSEPDGVVRDFFRRIRGKDSEFDALKGVEIVEMDVGGLLDRSLVVVKIKELRGVIESKISGGCGVILDLGDLKWLVEQPVGFGGVQPQHGIGRAAVAEMANLVRRFARDGGEEDEGGNKVWLIGTATCETYLRCQVYHSTMENDWDLQAVPIASRSPLPGMFPRMLNNPVEPLTSLRTVQTPLPTLTRSLSEKSDSVQQSTFCPKCSENCEKELARLTAIEKTFSTTKQDENRPSLPQWLQNAKLSDPKTSDKSQEKDGVLSKERTQELQKKWKDTCLNLHPNFHQKALPHVIRPSGPPALSIPGMYNPNLLSRPPFQPKLQTTKPLGNALQLNMNPITSPPTERVNTLNTSLLARQLVEQVNSPPGSPVGTDLVLGRKDTPEKPAEIQAKDFLSCISSEPQIKLFEKFANALDADTYKKLLKGLMEKAWWQAEAATALASAVTRCSLGNGKQRGGVLRGDVWLLFTGPDRVGKRKMVSVLADQICGAAPMLICLGSRRDGEDSETGFRGRTATDRIAEAVRRNPCSVIMLEDIDEADTLVRGSIKRAMERGRLTDTHGREVGLGNAVFILTGDWSTTSPEGLRDGHFVNERKLAEVASGNWELGLIVREKNAKRRAHWLHNDEDRLSKSRKEMGSGLSLDLNLTVDNDDGRADGSYNSSDLTIDHEDELGLVNRNFSIASVPHDLANNVDDSIVFKPVDSAFVRREINKTISVKFAMVVDENLQIEVDDDVLEKIMGGLWHDKTSLGQWIENVLEPSFDQLKPLLPGGDPSRSVVRLVVESDGVNRGKTSFGNANWLPSTILV